MIPNSQITHFDSRTIPTISLVAYLERLQKFAHFTNEALLSMLIYFDRISTSASSDPQEGFIIHAYNVHRLLIASLVVASKFTSDVYYTNSRYAKVGGLSVAELNQLELEFLFLIKFRLHIRLKKLQSF
ncbi:cyclin PHO80-like protein, partial [Mycotypha africana]|uniref:cyclin PHO80-like protein n=1 Tax=Mycotypha africana TaxID=64632 RepID=UPI002300AD83